MHRTYRSWKGIVRRRRTEVHALRGISFQGEQGELFGLLGPNGAGITSLRWFEYASRRSAALEAF